MSGRLIGVVVAACCLAMPASAGAGWRELVDGTLRADPALDAREVSAATAGGAMYMAWSEGSGQSADIRVARLERDGAWTSLPGPDPTANSWSIEPTLASIGGVLHVAWAERDTRFSENRFQVRVARLDEAGFTPVGGSPNVSTAADGRDPALADVGGVPHLAWIEGDQQSLDVRAARLADGAWQRTGSIDHSTRAAEAASASPLSLVQPVTRLNASDPVLAVIGGALHAAWSEGGFVYVARLDDDRWTELGGGAANGATGDGATQTTLTGLGATPLVAWRAAGGAFSVRAARLDGGSWSGLGQEIGTSANQPSLAAEDGTAWISWVQSGQLRVARLGSSGTAWEQPLDSALNELGGATASSPDLQTVGGVPVVAWSEGHAGGRSDVRLARLEPDLLGTDVSAGATSATAITRLRTFGLEFPVRLAYGQAGTTLSQSTAPSSASGDSVSVAAVLSGLSPRTAYEVRPVVEATAGADLAGPPVAFTTAKKNGK